VEKDRGDVTLSVCCGRNITASSASARRRTAEECFEERQAKPAVSNSAGSSEALLHSHPSCIWWRIPVVLVW